ncbi:Fic/DOC family N-terminal domain-containing protein [Corynebacterium sphenisci]|uniref:Fic/DOC family N-terminal domain-containing protein n=1 Tax=Corynebacterium sphenisci TaxID=191493 RepID=UPI0026E0757C|nr:Fic/DOC family N-terminal domain-containing protein [Corynebacterium sphenisci]MDO5731802.1 Fic/DOC family N-terminal domain-containing protein [Corynebacterium sphenisci]
MYQDPNHPYQDLPPLPPPHDVETKPVLKATVTASRALSRVNEACSRLPEPGMLLSLIPLMESRASNEIENIVTTNDELFQASNGILTHVTPQIKEAMR